jgi:membrane-associated phospholipid phosphatase
MYLDVIVATYFYHLRGFIKEFFSQYVTKLGKSEWILIGSLLIYFFYKKRNITFAYQGLFVFTSVAASGILVNILKVIFSRYRPKAYFQDGSFGFDLFAFKTKYIFNSFPSGHSVTAMGFAVALMLLFPKYRVWAFLFGAIVASSRFVITAHYLSDVLMGGLLGGLISYGLYYGYFKKKIS